MGGVKRSASRVTLMSIVARRHAQSFARLTEKVNQYGDHIHSCEDRQRARRA